jgi:hypothetical protein
LVSLCGGVPASRRATLRPIRSRNGEELDKGLILFFPSPNSFTGEDCAELQIHGGRATVRAILAALGELEGLRPAEAGEFSRRAFLNGRMDEVIFEEFKGTGNSEIVLDRKVADKRIFPAMDILKSGTRKEDLLVPRQDLQKIFVLRRILAPMGTTDAIEFLIDKLKQTKNNGDFFDSMNT